MTYLCFCLENQLWFVNEHSLWGCRIESQGSRVAPHGYCLVRDWEYIPLALFEQFHKETFYRVRLREGSYQSRWLRFHCFITAFQGKLPFWEIDPPLLKVKLEEIGFPGISLVVECVDSRL